MSRIDVKNPLYHGTIYDIEKIDVSKGRGRKDFGKGFYIATEKSQAIGMMHKKYHEALRRGRNKANTSVKEYLYEIYLDVDYIEKLKFKVFENADEEWLDFILACREHGGTPHDYDLIIGPTADDDTMFCLRAYWDGLYGEVGTIEAKRILLNNLETDNLGIQYFIGKQEVADKLIIKISKIEWS